MSSDGKRRLSSDGKTPKPMSKSSKMADPGKHESEFLDKMTVIAEAVERLQKGQLALQSILESKLDKFRNEFMVSIDEKFKAMKCDIDIELAVHKGEIDSLSRSIESVARRVEKIERTQADRSIHTADNVNTENILSDPDLTIIATNVKFEHDEDILVKARELVNHLDVDADVVAATRLKSRIVNKPGLVKISFSSVDEKVQVLRAKRTLGQIEGYRSVFLRSSKSHTERLIELNAKTLLGEMPNGKNFRITANGRIVRKTVDHRNTRGEPSD